MVLPVAVVVAGAVVGAVIGCVAPEPRATVVSVGSPAGVDAVLAARATAAENPSRYREELRAGLAAALTGLSSVYPSIDFGVAVVEHQLGVTYQREADVPLVTASVVKVEILAALLVQLRAQGRELTESQRRLAAAMIQSSDNSAADNLWRTIGSGPGLAEANAVFGLTATVPGPSFWWGATKTTAADQVALLEAINDPAGPLGASNALVLDLMATVVADQAWGVSAAAHPGETVRLKNGWVSLQSGWTVNSVGRITGPDVDLTIAVISGGHANMTRGIEFVEEAARTVRAALDAGTRG